ncbi:ankyrin repeat-containing protein [Aspergillus avenaceus]|uniref:Ankyrin repeat-containing protein n=1 Tax=Aspergillus avenaceus TaxID=36643 RepID=A0A5N6TSX4_ASPAV|nr:ankyrin repeat-containing protein [Aspergillus avenaceus]
MRFGLLYHQFQVPEWANSYVPYPSLKRLFNEAVTTDCVEKRHGFAELYTTLNNDIDSFCRAFIEKYNILKYWREELANRLNPKQNAASRSVSCYGLECNLKAALELRKDSEKLQWYYRVNKEAIEKIHSKLERTHCSTEQFHRDHNTKWIELVTHYDTLWLKHIEDLNELMVSIVKTRSETKSSCLEKTCKTETCLTDKALDKMHHAVMDDRFKELSILLQEAAEDMTMVSQFGKIIYDLAKWSLACGSRQCTNILISDAFSMYGTVLDNGLLSEMIIISGRNSIFEEQVNQGVCDQCASKKNRDGERESLFSYAINQIRPNEQDALLRTDDLGRLPLHYGALYGSQSVCESILELSLKWNQSYPRLLILSQDSQNFTPLHYAVINKHRAIVHKFLVTLESTEHGKGLADDGLAIINELLCVAIKLELDEMVHLLSRYAFCHQSGQSSRGETALYIAARAGHEKYVKLLLEDDKDIENTINIPEPVYGWTPLIVACVRGHQGVVDMLLLAGAAQEMHDHFGWIAREHAALRGHLALAQKLDSKAAEDPSGGPAGLLRKTAPRNSAPLQAGCHHAVINLGVLRNGKHVKAIELREPYPEELVHMNSGYSIEISVSEGGSTGRRLQLPVLQDMINEPFVFPIKNPDRALVAFKIYHGDYMQERGHGLLGSGTAFLRDLGHCLGENREGLIRERTIPILEKNTLNTMGSITFTLIMVKPIAQELPLPANPFAPQTGLQLVGHRGLGQNTASRNYLQLGENTVESFLSAAKQGATIVEDVQLTRDLVPIIYHDFSLSESGTDIPIHDLSFQQFMHASYIQSPQGAPMTLHGKWPIQSLSNRTQKTKPRSRSLTRKYERGTGEIRDRMKYTVDFINKGFKPNTRGDFIQGSFTTLEELLEQLPDTIGFNIEIKYPRIHEAEEAGVAPVAIEINTFIDEILKKLFSHPQKKRTIILSSFTPEVCILLSIKQPIYPVMFITNAGKPPVTDFEMRASSLQSAVRFAKRWNLSGIVFASEALVMCPRLIRYVQRSGLLCGSYGSQNNIPENAKVQAAAGIDIIMADRIGLIAKALG